MIRIGKIVATHGLQGSLVLTHVVGSSDWLKKGDVLFLELNKGSFIPFFVKTVKGVDDEEYIVTLEDVTVVEEAKKTNREAGLCKRRYTIRNRNRDATAVDRL